MFYYASKRRRNKKIILAIALAVVVALVVLVIIFSGDISDWFKREQKEPVPSQSPAVSTATPEPGPQKPIEETGLTVQDRFGVPEGFKRVSVDTGSFGEFLREYPLKAYGTVPKLFDGTDNTQAPTVGVLDQALISRNQESPDVIMMLYAQYLYEKKDYSDISFNALTTPAFPINYETWLTGQRVRTNGNLLEWYMPEDGAAEEPNEENFRSYLIRVMIHANTLSLKAQLMSASASNLKAGDVFIANGHAILVLDVCEHAETGEKRFICAEGDDKVNGAQVTETYILQDALTGSVWMSLEEDGSFIQGGSVYPADSIRRFN